MSDPVSTNTPSAIINGSLNHINDAPVEKQKQVNDQSLPIHSVAQESIHQTSEAFQQQQTNPKDIQDGRVTELSTQLEELSSAVEELPNVKKLTHGLIDEEISSTSEENISNAQVETENPSSKSEVEEEEDFFGDDVVHEDFESSQAAKLDGLADIEASSHEELAATQEELENVKEDASSKDKAVGSLNQSAAAHENDFLVMHHARRINTEDIRPDISNLEKRVQKNEAEISKAKKALADNVPVDVALNGVDNTNSDEVANISKGIDKGKNMLVASAASAALGKLKELAGSMNAQLNETRVSNIINNAVASQITGDEEEITEDHLEDIVNQIFKGLRDDHEAIFKLDSNGRKVPLNDSDWEKLENTFKESFKNALREKGLLLKEVEIEKEEEEQVNEENSRHQGLEGRNNREGGEKVSKKSNLNSGMQDAEGIKKGKIKFLQVLNEFGIQQAREAEKLYKKFLESIRKENQIKKEEGEKHLQNVKVKEQQVIKADQVKRDKGVKVSDGVKVKVKEERFDINSRDHQQVALVVRMKTVYNTSIVRG